MFWLFWQFCGVALAIGGGMLALVILWQIVRVPVHLLSLGLGWLILASDRHRAKWLAAETAQEEFRARAP